MKIRLFKRFLAVPAFIWLLYACGGGTQNGAIMPGSNAQKEIQTALLKAKPGAVIQLGEGVFELTGSLSLDGIDSVTIQGKGMKKTVLSFKNQTTGAEGVNVKNCKWFKIKDLAIEDTKGDALKIQDSENIVIFKVRTEWTGTPDSTNGAYGLYPVTCKNILIDSCFARGASDAGIYVGQSSHIIVRNSEARENVAGIEIENSMFAEVHNNVSENNTGGILVFDLPDLPVEKGGFTKVHHNTCIDNNHPNFAPVGNIVGEVPAGTGVIILATKNVEISDNTIENHRTFSVAIASYEVTERPVKNQKYKDEGQYPEAIKIAGNRIIPPTTFDPDTTRRLGMMKMAVYKELKVTPDIVWDGFVNTLSNNDPKKRICLKDNANKNGPIHFLNLKEGGMDIKKAVDQQLYDCDLDEIPEVKLPVF